MIISLVVAMAENRAIGTDNALPWHLPNDLKHFKQLTLGKPCVMGRKTYDSIGKPLPNRTNIILTKNQNFNVPGCTTANSPEQTIDIAQQLSAPELMIIGGASIYKLFYDKCDKIYLTLVHTNIKGDTYFLPIQEELWQQVSKEHHNSDDKHEYSYSFITLQRSR